MYILYIYTHIHTNGTNCTQKVVLINVCTYETSIIKEKGVIILREWGT